MSMEIGYAESKQDRLAANVIDDPFSKSNGRRVSILHSVLTKKNSFLFFVLLPSILAAFYYGLIASNQYAAEIRMVVRTIGVSEQFDASEKRDGRSVIGGDSLTQDSYMVANYLTSPEIVRKLNDGIGLATRFSKDNIDVLSRLPKDASLEELQRYWLRQIDTYVDGPSGIIVFTVRAFSPEDSVAILREAMAAADAMIDKISEKAKQDLVTRAEADVAKGLEEYHLALDRLREYQNATGILDPTSSARLVSTVIAKLIEEKLSLVVELKALEAANANDSARVRQLRRSIDALDEQINLRQDSLAGRNVSAEQLSQKLTEFSRLETQKIVAQALYEANMRNLDTAKSTALRRTTFISVFSNAYLPEKSKYPDRLASWLIFFFGLSMLWMIVSLLWMSVEDHRV